MCVFSPGFSMKLKTENMKWTWVSAIMHNEELNDFYLGIKGKGSLANLEGSQVIHFECRT